MQSVSQSHPLPLLLPHLSLLILFSRPASPARPDDVLAMPLTAARLPDHALQCINTLSEIMRDCAPRPPLSSCSGCGWEMEHIPEVWHTQSVVVVAWLDRPLQTADTAARMGTLVAARG